MDFIENNSNKIINNNNNFIDNKINIDLLNEEKNKNFELNKKIKQLNIILYLMDKFILFYYFYNKMKINIFI